MTKLNTNLNTEYRELAIEELEIVAGGVMEGGCIRLPDIFKLIFPKPFRDPVTTQKAF